MVQAQQWLVSSSHQLQPAAVASADSSSAVGSGGTLNTVAKVDSCLRRVSTHASTSSPLLSGGRRPVGSGELHAVVRSRDGSLRGLRGPVVVLRVESSTPAVTLSFGAHGPTSVSSADVLTGGGDTGLPAHPPSLRAARVAVCPSWTVESVATGVLADVATSGERRDEVTGDAALWTPSLVSWAGAARLWSTGADRWSRALTAGTGPGTPARRVVAGRAWSRPCIDTTGPPVAQLNPGAPGAWVDTPGTPDVQPGPGASVAEGGASGTPCAWPTPGAPEATRWASCP